MKLSASDGVIMYITILLDNDSFDAVIVTFDQNL